MQSSFTFTLHFDYTDQKVPCTTPKHSKRYSEQTSLRNKFRYLNRPADGFACIAVLISYVDLRYLTTLFQYFVQFN
jgi:hypothetical protein